MNVICPSCGAEFNKNLSQCPYCGNSNYYGQEKSYMKGLAGLRQRLAELADINKKIIVEEYIEKGCLMQCNYGSIVNLYGNEAEKTIKTLLKKNQVHFLGSDVHREKGTYLIIPETIKKIKKIVGESKLQELTTINPQKILKNEEWE